ncbi:DUF1003 domain-containing protein [Angustibacter sp. McL0619]|uniref:DUF1003 domain-containing protein n=1 Tax=Angustibacter sp. McL0619 TaxID=3415676 RepID=UPI003CEF5474
MYTRSVSAKAVISRLRVRPTLAATVRCCDSRSMSIPHRAGPGSHHPAVAEDLRKHSERLQGSIADLITRYAGSMLFVYVHIAIFATWMLLLEKNPWPTLTLVVSLEAIFLSTFVMIGQNRQASFQQNKADHDFLVEEQELHANTELTKTLEVLTREIHAAVVKTRPGTGAG